MAPAGKGSNSVQLRHFNERVVLDALRRMRQASKAEIARACNLTPPAVAAIVEALVEAGYARENGKRFGGKGQPSAMYELAEDGAYSIGLHIGRRSVDGVLLGFAGQTVDFESHEYEYPNPVRVRELGNGIIARHRRKLGAAQQSRLVGIGISAPYFIGGWDHELGFPEGVTEAWRAADLQGSFFETNGLSVQVENDASAAAVAELVQGIGAQYRDFLHVSLTTFVGAGLVLNGILQTGPHGNTAAFGPFPVTPSRLSTVPTPEAGFDVLLHRASVYGLVNHLRASGHSVNRVRELDPVPQGAKRAIAEWQDDCAEALAQAIIGTISIVDLEAVVVDGLLPRPLLLDTVAKIRTQFAQLMPRGLIAPEILVGSLGARASAVGAALLPIYSMFGPDTGVLTRRASDKKLLMIGKLT